MNKVIVISMNSGLYSEWNSIEHLEVTSESFESLINDMNKQCRFGDKFYIVSMINGTKRAINLEYVTDIWEKKVE